MERELARCTRASTTAFSACAAGARNAASGHKLLQLQRLVGNQVVMRLIAPGGVQVSHPNDDHEAVADSVARRVMSARGEEALAGLLGAHPTRRSTAGTGG